MRCGIFSKKTAKLWVWRAYDPDRRRTLAWVLGGRDDATCQKRLDRIGLQGKRFITDDWPGDHRLIPAAQLTTGKHLTFPIEQDNSNIRHFLARFRRRTKVVSKTEEMVDLSLRLYHHLHDHPAAFAALSATFLSIFG
jgi:insertion element IS1 protein InsB